MMIDLKKDDILLANHRVSGKGVFPAVGYFEIVLKELLSSTLPGLVFPLYIREAFWPAPLTAENGPQSVKIDVRKEKEDYLYTVGTRANEAATLHARGRVCFPLFKADPIVSMEIESLLNGFSRRKDRKSCYEAFERINITYDHMFKSIREFQWDDNQSFVKIEVVQKEMGFQLSPGFLDASIQCALLHIFECFDSSRTYVPFSLSEFCILQNLPDSGFARAILKESNPDKGYFIFDLILADEQGHVAAFAKQVCIKTLLSVGDTDRKQEKEHRDKWAVAATFTAEPIKEALAFWQTQFDTDAKIVFAPYNQVFQELLSPVSLLSRNLSGANIILFRLEDLKAHSAKGLTALPLEEKNLILADRKRFVLPNDVEIAHLNPYETRYLYDEIFVQATYLKQGITLPDDAVIIDIGANIGMFSLFVANQCNSPKIFCFEPSPVTFDVLKTNMALYAPDAVAVNCGIADSNREAQFTFYPRSSVFSGFHTDEKQDGEALRKAMENEIMARDDHRDKKRLDAHLDAQLDLMLRDRLQAQTFSCQLRTLSSLIKEHAIEKIDLLKVDAEKCEWEILSSINDEDWPKIGQVVVEVHDETGKLLKRVKTLLKKKGFEISTIEEELLESSGLYNIYGKRPGLMRHDTGQIESGIEKNINELIELIKGFSKRNEVPFLLGMCPSSPDAKAIISQSFSKKIANLIKEQLNAHSTIQPIRFLEYKNLYQWQSCHDAFRDEMGRIPYTPEFFIVMATVLARRLFTMNQAPYKVVALDCDNTLWKGVVGEQGASGIDITSGHTALQEFLLKLKEKGMLLCLVSKNSEDDVKTVFTQRNDMVLKWDDITGKKINWEIKSANLASLAGELNLGLDSFIFLDDSPVECAEVRANSPQVLTLQVPENPDEMVPFLNHIWAFDLEGGTKEDAKRTELYKQNMEREQFRKRATTFTDFIGGLKLDIRIVPVRQADLARVSQLTHRTNQFNFQKHPRDIDRMRSLLAEEHMGCHVVHVADRFGDYGLCGVMIYDEKEDRLVLDAFLLSCRVLGRGVEHKMLSWLGQKALESAKSNVLVPFVPTPKNMPANKFLQGIGSSYHSQNQTRHLYTFPTNFLKTLAFQLPETLEKTRQEKSRPTGENQKEIVQKSLFMQNICTRLNSLGAVQKEIKEQKAVPRQKTQGNGLPKTQENMPVSQDAATVFAHQIILEKIQEVLDIDSSSVDPGRPFNEYGIDSLLGIDLIVLLNQELDIVLPTTILFDYSSVKDLAMHLCQGHLLSTQKSCAVGKLKKSGGEKHQLDGTTSFDLNHSFLIKGPGKVDDIATVPLSIQDPGPDEIQILIKAFSLNFSDLLSVKGLYPMMPAYPFVPGSDVAGIVVKTGSNVTRFSPGDPVIAVLNSNMGGHATLVNTLESYAVEKPSGITFEQGAALPFAFLTVQYALEKACLKSGEKILIQTAAGGVGLMAVQMSGLSRARIYATAGSSDKLAFLKDYGIHFGINYKKEDFKEKILELTNGQGVDVVLNTLGGDAIQKGLDILASGGRYIEIALAGLKGSNGLDLSRLTRNQSFISVNIRTWIEAFPQGVRTSLEKMAHLLSEGMLTVTIDRCFPFSQLKDAYQYLESGSNIGKVVVSLPETKGFKQTVAQIPAMASTRVEKPDKKIKDIAVVGLSGRFPKAADIKEFWDLLSRGESGIQTVPENRWSIREHYDSNPGAQNKTYSKWGGFLDDPDQFDALFFNISGREAELIDPQQRIFLEESWKALEDAGYAVPQDPENRWGVFVGADSGDYKLLMSRADVPKQAAAFMGNHASILASRIAYFLNLKGACLAIDTACSSSLAAVHMACESLRKNEMDLALAGGVSIRTTPDFHILCSKAGMLSHDDKCRVFDENADGFVPGEAVGVVVLKRLEDALRDRDHIYGVIKGSAMNQDGRTNGITAPNGLSQTQLAQKVYEQSNINPGMISYVEAHGTGTPLGDPIEINALSRAFRKYTPLDHFCAVGSVKSNIGHCIHAAGISSLIKLILCLKHKKLVPTLNCENPNPKIEFDNSPFFVNTRLCDWQVKTGHERIGAVSSFGFSGTNVHMVAAQAPLLPQTNQIRPSWELVVLSARTRTALMQMGQNLKTALETGQKELLISEVAFTLGVGRSHFEYRWAMVARDIPELIHLLCELLLNKEPFFSYTGYGLKSSVRQTRQAAQLTDTIGKIIEEGTAIHVPEYQDKLSELGQLFVKGGETDFNPLYNTQLGRKSLPTYPFSKDRYWVISAVKDKISMTSSPVISSLVLHPMLHENVSGFSQQRYRSAFTGQEFFIRDHVILGQKVLPAVAYLEMARAAVEASTKGDIQALSRFENMVWLHPFTMGPRDNSPDPTSPDSLQVDRTSLPQRNVHVSLSMETDKDSDHSLIHYRIQEDISGTGIKVLSQGDAVLAGLPQPRVIDLAALKEQMGSNPISRQECYRAYKGLGVDYGPAHQGLDRLWVNSNGALAKIVLPDTVTGTMDAFVIHPSIFDAALQATLGLTAALSLTVAAGNDRTFSIDGPLFLPFALELLEIYHKAPSSLWAWIRNSQGRMVDTRTWKLDIDLCDGTGQCCARMKGLALRVSQDSLSRENHSPPVDFELFRSVWTDQAPGKKYMDKTHGDKDLTEKDPVRRLILLCELDPIRPESIASRIKGAVCEPLLTGPGSKEADQNLSLASCFKQASLRLFHKIRDILQDKPMQQVFVQILFCGDDGGDLFSGLGALLKTAFLENPRICGQLVRVDRGMNVNRLVSVLTENFQDPDSTWIRYQNGRRQILSHSKILQDETLEDKTRAAPLFKDGGIYLITGGAGGLGLVFAREIADQVEKPILILMGRSSQETLDARDKIQEIMASGARVEYRQADVCRPDDVNDLMESLTRDYGTLDGIFHCAGVIRDNYILKKDPDEFLDVISPKIDGTVNLYRAAKEIDFDFFVLFSSQAGVTGNPGQSDYSLGNAFMDAFAGYQHGRNLKNGRSQRIISLDWPLWESGGMKVGPGQDIPSLETRKGFDCFYKAMATGFARVLIQAPKMQKAAVAPLKVSVPLSVRPSVPFTGKKGTEPGAMEETALGYFKTVFSTTLKLPVQRVDVDEPLETYGVDSTMAMELTNHLETDFGRLSKTLFFEYQSIRELAQYFLEAFPDKLANLLGIEPDGKFSDSLLSTQEPVIKPAPVKTFGSSGSFSRQEGAGSDIAIIGLSGRYPKSEDVAGFWENLKRGEDCITQIPGERWDWEKYYSGGRDQPGGHHSKWGGFIDDADKFDPLFFNISPLEAEYMDPQERLFLEYSWAALEDAGYCRRVFTKKDPGRIQPRVGVYAGVMYGEYQVIANEARERGNTMVPSGSYASIANRVSYLLNLKGPSMAVDTMCSSSITCIHLACQELRTGQIDMALAGGVNLSLHPNKYLMLSNGQYISGQGHCESFGNGSGGYIPGEGIGVVVLKSLSQAKADNDHIYGIIRGSAINHGGKTNGYSVPNPGSQAEVIQQALTQARIDPGEVSYIEAHGTGTKLGDPIEIAGLTRAFETGREGQFCKIGSVKSNIGHGESAAGIAGLTKVLLQMKYGQIVPSLHSNTLNPNIDFENTPFVVNQTLQPWEQPMIDGKKRSRIAGISSFGAGGANAHILIEEYQSDSLDTNRYQQDGPWAVLLSAANEERLRVYAQKILRFVPGNVSGKEGLTRLAYTLQVGREPLAERLGLIINSVQDLEEKLRAFVQSPMKHLAQDGIFHGQVKPNRETIAVLSHDDDMQKTLTAWINKGKFAKLLDFWVKGLDINWPDLYHNNLPKKMSLPTYPFERQRYWIPTQDKSRVTTGGVEPLPHIGVVPAVHPLLHQNISGLSGICFSSFFTGKEFFLDHHRVQGRKIMPAVACLEMARAALESAGTDLSPKDNEQPPFIFMKDVTWTQPLSVEDTGKKVHIRLFPQDRSPGVSTILFEIFSFKGEMNPEKVIYSQGKAGFFFQDGSANGENFGISPLAELKSRLQETGPTPDQCYEAYQAMGIDYGTTHKCLEHLYYGDGQVLARLALSEKGNDNDLFGLHPGILDGALQASIVLTLNWDAVHGFDHGELKPPLPFALESMEIFSSCRSLAWAHVRQEPGQKPNKPGGGEWFSMDITLYDDRGLCCVRMKGLVAVAVGNTKGIHEESPLWDANPGPELKLLIPQWDPVPVPETKAVDHSERVLLNGGTREQQRQIAAAHPTIEILEIPAKSEQAEVTECFKHYSGEHVIFIAPDTGLPAIDDQRLVLDQEKGVVTLFKIVKSVLALGYGTRDLVFTIITTRAQAVHKHDRPDPVHAAIHGLTGSMAKEFVHWQIRVLDMAEQGEWPVKEMFSMPFGKKGNCLANRHSEWFSQSLVPVKPLPETGSVFKKNGVYIILGGAGGIGEALTRYLIAHYQGVVIWIGRRKKDPTIEKQLAALSESGLAPDYIRADAADRTSLEKAYHLIKTKHPRIHGIVHSTLVLADGSLANMEEVDFYAPMAAKAEVSLCMAQVFQNEPLDFVLFFSSLVSYIKPAGQSNYTAACSFKDAFAIRLGQEWNCPVRVLNWGYWGSLGAVSDDIYQKRMAAAGIGSIEPSEGMAAIETLLSGPLTQLGFLKTIKDQSMVDISKDRWVSINPDSNPNPDDAKLIEIPRNRDKDRALAPERAFEAAARTDFSQMEALTLDLLWATLHRQGLLPQNKLNPGSITGKIMDSGVNRKWLDECLGVFEDKKYLRKQNRHTVLEKKPQELESLWNTWEQHEKTWGKDPDLKARAQLTRICVKALPDILSGKIKMTDVMFSESSMELVEGIYKGNAVSDLFNTILGNTLVSLFQDSFSNPTPGETAGIRILEIGAGTGGTTQTVLNLLDPFKSRIKEYCYTDISQAFLMHGQDQYGSNAPYFVTKRFDVTTPLADQKMSIGTYDAVIATNVLHATPDIRATLLNAKALLKNKGVLLINEICGKSAFALVTFGLLPAWWNFNDPSLRIPGSPGLNPETWGRLLSEQGFKQVFFPAEQSHHLGFQIIAGQSDGVVGQRVTASHAPGATNMFVPGHREKNRAKSEQPDIGLTALGQDLEKGIRETIKQKLSESLKVNIQQIDTDEPFAEYGVDSITGVNLIRQINESLGIELETISLFDYNSVDLLTDYILTDHSGQIRERTLKKGDRTQNRGTRDSGAVPITIPIPIQSQSQSQLPGKPELPGKEDAAPFVSGSPIKLSQREGIAVVGMSGRFARSKNLEEFWENLCKGKDLVEEITRWDWPEIQAGAEGSEKLGCRHGSFLSDIDQFDPLFFKISPKEAVFMDPQQRIFLEEAYHALEDAGYAGKSIGGTSCGVYVGCGSSDYKQLIQKDAPAQAFWGNAGSIIPARVAYNLNLHGPAISVDTACSSSLVAIHNACQGLWEQEIDMALAGGIFVQSTPEFYGLADRAGMLSSKGRCHTFDQAADGFVPGEGAGVVVLKRLSDALSDNDHIHGVIIGSGINQDGTTNGITAPSAASQERLALGIYDRFNINPETISMVEAHGTGTVLGDPIEIKALTNTFGKYTSRENYCALGSVKTNIGHSITASGIAGLLKVLLSLKHEKMVPSLHYKTCNPNIRFEGSPFYVNTRLKPWHSNGNQLRRAAVSSFGFSGTNAHMVIEQAPQKASVYDPKPWHLVALSARTSGQLTTLVQDLLDFCRSRAVDLGNMSYTLLTGRKHMNHRLAFLAQDVNQLTDLLEQWGETTMLPQVYLADLDGSEPRDRAMEETGNRWIQDLAGIKDPTAYGDQLSKLARFHVQGVALDFLALFDRGYSRICLPVYPFERQSCWVGQPPAKVPVVPNRAETAGEKTQGIHCFEETWEPVDREMIRSTGHQNIKRLVCLLSHPERKRFSKKLREMMPDVETIFVGQSKTQSADDLYILETDSPEGYDALFRQIQNTQGTFDALVCLWPHENADLVTQFSPVVNLLKAVEGLKDRPKRILLCNRFRDGMDESFADAWIGFSTSLKSSMPDTHVRVFIEEKKGEKKEKTDYGPVCRSLFADVFNNVLCRDNLIYHPILKPVLTQVTPDFGTSVFKTDVKTVLITGGLGKIGHMLSLHLATRYQSTLILTGRSVLSEEKKAALRVLEAAGSHVFYIRAEAGDEKALETGLKEVADRTGGVQGVIHLAGIQGSTRLADGDLSQFQAVLHPKITGTLTLDRVLEKAPLEFICYFSSSAAILGDFGSCDYSVANRFQNGYARCRNRLTEKGRAGGRAVSINWPLWESGGMGFDTDEETRFYLQTSGQAALPTAEGLALFERLLSGGREQTLVLSGDRERIHQILGLVPKSPMGTPGQMPDKRDDQKAKEQAILVENSPGESVEPVASLEPLEPKALVEPLVQDLKQLVGQVLKIPLDELNPQGNLADFGFDSISLTELAQAISSHFDLSFSPSLFYGNSTIDRITQYLIKEELGPIKKSYQTRLDPPQNATVPNVADPNVVDTKTRDKNTAPAGHGFARKRPSDFLDEPIAVIGMAGRFPGADTVDGLWQNIVSGTSCITTIPEDRWDFQAHYDPTGKDPKKSCSKWGGFMKDIDKFDPLFFEISPRDAVAMDPAQRLFLQEAWHAFEDAGYLGNRIKGTSCGVYVGVEEGEYGTLVSQGDMNSNQNATLAGRIAYFLDLKGPNMALTASCSSGLVALHQACMGLRLKECDMALAGGVHLLISPDGYLKLSQANMLSPDGICRVFDHRSNGMVPGEAVAAVVLKPLSKAILDKDRIYGCIRASGMNYDGKTNGITAPNLYSQADLIQSVHERYQINSEQIQYVMAHSVGSKIGDPVEIEALDRAFKKRSKNRGFCSLGSVKPIVGHTFAASGVVSLISMLMAMNQDMIPGMPRYDSPNAHIRFQDSAFKIHLENKKWENRNNTSLLGVIGTVGVSGTNAHAVIEKLDDAKANRPADKPAISITQSCLFVLSARDNERLEAYARQMATFLTVSEEVNLENVTFTLQTGRQPFKERLAFAASSIGSCIETLNCFVEGKREDTFYGTGMDQPAGGTRNLIITPGDISEWIDKNKVDSLAMAWVQGAAIPFETLYKGDALPSRIRLPGYPFQKKRYWPDKGAHLPTPPGPIDSKKTDSKKRADKEMSIEKQTLVLSLKAQIKQLFLEFFLIDEQIDENQPFFELGVTSVNVVEFVELLESRFDVHLEVNDLFNYPTLYQLAEYVETLLPDPGQSGRQEGTDLQIDSGDIQDTLSSEEGPDIDGILQSLSEDHIDIDQALALINKGVNKGVNKGQENGTKMGVNDNETEHN